MLLAVFGEWLQFSRNLLAWITSFICIISKRWSFSGSEGQFTDTGSEGRTNSIAKDVREFRSGQEGRGHRVRM